MKPRILVVDDKASNLKLLAEILGAGYEVRTAEHGDAALASIAADEPDVVVSDIRMPRTDGFALLRAVKERHPRVEVVLMTAFGSIPRAVEAVKEGAFDYLTKPLDPDQVVEVVDRALERVRIRDAAAGRPRPTPERDRFGELIGASAAMQRLFSLLDRAAASDATVLILGESGTGKEVTARSLHQQSRRKGGSFVPVNCGALPANLIESELFGHAKGAFTGAGQASAGLFGSAEGGTLFLDEVGELPLDVQVKLNRAVQERAVRPVGAGNERRVDVRVVAATNRNLEAEIRQGRFREDLYYRLNVFTVTLPPLRDRKDDIPQLAAVLLERQKVTAANPDVQGFDEAALAAMMSYGWPGNVRELENVIARALALAEGARVGLDDLPAQLTGGGGGGPVTSPTELGYKEAVELARDRASREYLVSLMTEFEGNVTRAADKAGMERESLHRLLKKHGIQPQDFRAGS